MKFNKYLFIITGAIFIGLLLFFLYPRQYIIVEADGYQSLYLEPDTFELHWIHSIEKEEWFEVYTVEDSALKLTTSHFKTFGAGVPASSDEPSYIEDGFVVYTINDIYEEIYLNVSENVRTTIVQDDTEYHLYNWFDSYVSVKIYVGRTPLLLRL